MSEKQTVLGVYFGDLAGIGPEISVKTLAKKADEFIPLVVEDKEIVLDSVKKYAPELEKKLIDYSIGDALESGNIYVLSVPVKTQIQPGVVSRESGEHSFDTFRTTLQLSKDGIIEGVLMAPITKQAMALAEPGFYGEIKLFNDFFELTDSAADVSRKDDLFRASVTGHIPFRTIVDNISIEGIVKTGSRLIDTMARFGFKDAPIAVAAINPHASENGLFGDEEEKIIEPAIVELRKKYPNTKIIGPSPADTVFIKAIKGEVRGVVFHAHDQGNTPMKTWGFDGGVYLYVNTPVPVISPNHGSALDIGGKGLADSHNLEIAVDTILQYIRAK
ncbi:4-hydroxythreonine-4-phosphate dehydrogenase [Clostridia bacterium]|nr:4-hydroxythreonine-4-phosphate dehydrogenase [Clostridia bacterium]